MTHWKRFDRAEYAQDIDRRPLPCEMLAALDELLELEGSENVLDVGTGTGRVAVRILPMVPRGCVRHAAYTALADTPQLRERFEARYVRCAGDPPRVTGKVIYAALAGRRMS